MEKVKYRLLLHILHLLVHLKRFLFWIFKKSGLFFVFINKLFRNSLGFYFYKLIFRLQKKIGQEDLPLKSRIWEIFGRRGVLQVLFFGIALLVIYPHSSLYSYASTQIPGRGTVFFRLVGPGEQDFSLEEVATNYVAANTSSSPSLWNQGAVYAQSGGSVSINYLPAPEISGMVNGGGALVKPSVLSGSVFVDGGSGSIPGSGREGIVFHKVEVGENIGFLAQKYGISVATILWANNLTERSYIRPGDNLKILPMTGLVHKVTKGQTLGKIASLYKVKTTDIVTYNKLKEDGADIVVGEELLIPGGTKIAVAVASPTKNPTRQYYGLNSVAAPPANSAGSGDYLWPAGVRRITQYFGWRHTGLDIAGPIGTSIYATRAGVVTRSQCGYNGGYGCYIIIDHGGGLSSLYGHNSRLFVSVGESVAQGQNIALMGSTGRSTGPHIHFEIRVNGVRVNPLKYIR
ncbi:MAG: Peptidase M23 family protein [Candidatus Magasanikbacteria bacterium GW2011_GWC2_37_14]|uniref:Peptidase M23 family protein n=1 Tax=Candidatus Magasanikbacteria bacterium GW2011_GWC2_37_14 TaxID=1619046 RepID=A0A0G0GC19_9BACT|nr:MAG: Peptidase M23 family protein [Candidatus Magasanikbacteria bacterium GW2011_GWC2_37_14]